MKNTPMIPYDYATWHHCITVECGIELSLGFIHRRLQILHNPKEYEHQRFSQLYGEAHLQKVLVWFAQAEREMQPH